MSWFDRSDFSPHQLLRTKVRTKNFTLLTSMLFPTYQFLVFFLIIFSAILSLKPKVDLYKIVLLISRLCLGSIVRTLVRINFCGLKSERSNLFIA
ncbi:MAG: hypothetical protein EAZ10_18495 [Oscillatoriales cyanobacterium]|nr:MAG: hypothetical protein EAZ10_18495 [Oscillatoriales cyanobacterium]